VAHTPIKANLKREAVCTMKQSRQLWVGLVVVVAAIAFHPSLAHAQSCPGPTTEVHPNKTLGAQQNHTYPLTLEPCQTIVAEISATVPNHPDAQASMNLVIKNGVNQNLATTNFLCTASCADQVPRNYSTAGPGWFPGYLGPSVRPVSLVVSAGSFNWWATPPLTYTLTIRKMPRPGYNIGGSTFGTAPTIDLPDTVLASLHDWETNGQYWKIQLQPNETVTVVGMAMAHPTYGSAYSVRVFDSAFVDKKLLVSKVINGKTPFAATSTYTHTGAQAADYYVRARSGAWPTHDIVMTIGTLPNSCSAAPINRKGFRPGSVVPYQFNGPWGVERTCVESALAQWTASNSGTGLNVSFVPATGAPALTLTKTTLPPGIGGGATAPTGFDVDGYITGIGLQFSDNTSVLESCTGFRKVALHELGHAEGLGDASGSNQSSVMNQMAGKDDGGKNIPIVVTSCDAQQAYAARNAP
jgi:hypothetical protein